MTSQILKPVDFTNTQNSRYLDNEALFFPQIKKNHELRMKGYVIAKNSFVAEVTFKGAVADLRYFARSKFSRSLVHKKNFSLT